jgi:hypothetical protein
MKQGSAFLYISYAVARRARIGFSLMTHWDCRICNLCHERGTRFSAVPGSTPNTPDDGVEHHSQGGLSVDRGSHGRLTATVTDGVDNRVFGVQTQEAGPEGKFGQSTSPFGDSLLPKLGQWEN